MQRNLVSLMLASSLLVPSLALAGPNEDLAKGMAQGKSTLVEQAILKGANPNQLVAFKDGENWTPLIWAARWGNLQLVKLLLSKRSKINMKLTNSRSALMIAAENGHAPVVKLLLERGADPNLTNPGGNTSLMWAAWKGHLEVVKLLIDHNADIQIDRPSSSVHGVTLYTALTYAYGQGHIDVAKYLIEKGANGDMLAGLYDAAWEGHTDMILWLLAKEPKFNTQNMYNELLLKSMNGIKNGPMKLVTFLLEKGADPNFQDEDGYTALMSAALFDTPDMVTFLLEKGAAPNAQNKNGETALMRAAGWASLDIVNVLIEKGANPNLKNNDGQTALDFARENEKESIVKYLVAHPGL